MSLLLRRSRLHWGMDPWLDIRTLLHGMGRPLDRRSVVFDAGANLGRMTTASGHNSRALNIGMAERTPWIRAM